MFSKFVATISPVGPLPYQIDNEYQDPINAPALFHNRVANILPATLHKYYSGAKIDLRIHIPAIPICETWKWEWRIRMSSLVLAILDETDMEGSRVGFLRP